MRHSPRQSRRPSNVLRTAAAMAVVAPALALAPAVQAAGDSPEDPAQPKLEVSALQEATLKPGEVHRELVTLTNNGTAPAEGILFRIRLSRGLAFPESDSGCVYTPSRDQGHQALCRLPGTLQPGASTTVPVPFKVLSKALMESVDYGTSDTGGDPVDELPSQWGTASYRETRLKADNTADLAAVGDEAWGRPGRTVTVRVSLRNDGPGWVHINDSDDQAALMVTVPPGTVAVKVPSQCLPFDIDGPSGESQPGKPRYVCGTPDNVYDTGSVHSFTFKLRVKWSTHGTTTGEAKATSVYDIHPAYDHNAANDKAAITVRVAGHQEVPGAGSGPSPTPAAAAKDTTSGTHASSTGNAPQAQTGARSDTSLATESDDTDLAGTGVGSGTYVAGAGAVAAAGLGGMVFLAARRRREGSS